MNIFGYKIERSTPQKKGMSTGLQWAVAQDSIMFSIGDTAQNYLKEGYQKNPNLFAIIIKMVRTALKAKIELYDITNMDKPEIVPDSPLLDILHRPNPMMGRKEFIESSLSYKWVTGECFIYKNRGIVGKYKGKVGWLVVIPSQFITAIRQDATGQIEYYRFQNGNVKQNIAAEDMIFIKCFNPDGGARGQSPLMAGREILSHDNDIITSNRKLTKNMGPDKIITLGDGTGDYDNVQIEAFETKVAEKYGGKDNYGRKMFTSEKVTATDIGDKADDLGFYEASKLTTRQLCNIYGISSQLLNDPENKTYNNMLDARKALITEVVIPEMETFLSALNHSLVPEFVEGNKKYELRINKTAYEELKEDLLNEVSALAAAFWLTVNEKRKAMGYDPLDIPAGDEIFMPVNTEPISIKADAMSQLSNSNPK